MEACFGWCTKFGGKGPEVLVVFFWISADPLLSLFQLTHGTTWASCLAPSSLSYTGLPTPGPRGLSHHLGLGLDLPFPILGT